MAFGFLVRSPVVVIGAGSAAPGAPTGVVATAGVSQVSLSWTAVSGATGYNVKRVTSGGSLIATLSSNQPGTTFADTSGISNGTTYYYAVSALSGGVESANSGVVNATPYSRLVVGQAYAYNFAGWTNGIIANPNTLSPVNGCSLNTSGPGSSGAMVCASGASEQLATFASPVIFPAAGTPWAISIWQRVDTVQTLNAIAGNNYGTAGQWGRVFNLSNASVYYADDANNSNSVSVTIPSGWNHYVFSSDGTNLKIYVNSVLKLTAAPHGPYTVNHLGGLSAPGGSYRSLIGALAQAYAWGRALTDGVGGEVSELFGAGNGIVYPYSGAA